MLASNDNSYLKEYVRRQSVLTGASARPAPGPDPHAGRLLTDRSEYIRFLESQLDAVTLACLTAQSFDDRITSLGTAAVTFDEKLLNLARLIKCSQSVEKEQEAAYHGALDELNKRVRASERSVGSLMEVEASRVFIASEMLQ
eukprot:CAMPEP_0197596504 /NCGR_PEP_ID=MMETSP1326-20131121/25202_1 /TAXON_ID=1155430 /ORGANISM="Genus nov. species nov., Strain RCC2288" /LENGTH=142 /DNA_ID=CAMNT_0043163013 /DNA_START=271 /DNA_END=696 /DNA_ORIENTATION=-